MKKQAVSTQIIVSQVRTSSSLFDRQLGSQRDTLLIHFKNTVPTSFPSEKSLQESGMCRESGCKLGRGTLLKPEGANMLRGRLRRNDAERHWRHCLSLHKRTDKESKRIWTYWRGLYPSEGHPGLKEEGPSVWEGKSGFKTLEKNIWETWSLLLMVNLII